MPRIEMGKTYRTRDGKPARVIAVDRVSLQHPVLALVKTSATEEHVYSYTTDGKYAWTIETSHDLIEVKPEITGWVNIYKVGTDNWYAFKKTREDADGHARAERIACIPITFREGDGLEDAQVP